MFNKINLGIENELNEDLYNININTPNKDKISNNILNKKRFELTHTTKFHLSNPDLNTDDLIKKFSPIPKPDFSSIEKKENTFAYKNKGSYKKQKLNFPDSPIKTPNLKFSTPDKFISKTEEVKNSCMKLDFYNLNELTEIENNFNSHSNNFCHKNLLQKNSFTKNLKRKNLNFILDDSKKENLNEDSYTKKNRLINTNYTYNPLENELYEEKFNLNNKMLIPNSSFSLSLLESKNSSDFLCKKESFEKFEDENYKNPKYSKNFYNNFSVSKFNLFPEVNCDMKIESDKCYENINSNKNLQEKFFNYEQIVQEINEFSKKNSESGNIFFLLIFQILKINFLNLI